MGSTQLHLDPKNAFIKKEVKHISDWNGLKISNFIQKSVQGKKLDINFFFFFLQFMKSFQRSAFLNEITMLHFAHAFYLYISASPIFKALSASDPTQFSLLIISSGWQWWSTLKNKTKCNIILAFFEQIHQEVKLVPINGITTIKYLCMLPI